MKSQRLFIALLRGVNVGGRARVSMSDLRSLCETIGWYDVRTYIQSGNVIFRASGHRDVLENELEAAIPHSFGLSCSVIVRTAGEWREYLQANPFRAESATAPNRVMIALSKTPPAAGALSALRKRAGSERVERVGDAVWIYYADGAGRSRVTPGMLDAAMGSPTTTRNWRTVAKIAELVHAYPTDGSRRR